jgi:hypothetical protein
MFSDCTNNQKLINKYLVWSIIIFVMYYRFRIKNSLLDTYKKIQYNYNSNYLT